MKQKGVSTQNSTLSKISVELVPKNAGKLIIIGGGEDKRGEKRILKTIVDESKGGKIIITTLASRSAPGELWIEYKKVFTRLGAKEVLHLDLDSRDHARWNSRLKLLDRAKVIFFTGGDQLRITSQLGGTLLSQRIRQIYLRGGLLCGTSAGASVMSEVMLISGTSRETHRIGGALNMAPGLGYVRGMIIDQHFAERGRIGRLLGALALNPEYLGIGIDEDTAIIIENNQCFRTIGAGGVYILDGREISDTNISENSPDRTLSLYNVKLHVLGDGDQFNLIKRKPTLASRSENRRTGV